MPPRSLRLGGVLHDHGTDAPGDRQEPVDGRRLAEEVDRDDDAGGWARRRLHRIGIDEERIAVDVGKALVLFTTACMVLAALVLTTTGRGYLRPALIQGTLPLIGFVLFALS
jgi:hypothetical protein